MNDASTMVAADQAHTLSCGDQTVEFRVTWPRPPRIDESEQRIAAANQWLDENWDKAVEVARRNTRRLIGRDSV